MYTHQKYIVKKGKPVDEAKAALILIHGRGATARNILTLAQELDVKDMALYAPQATNQSWYPYSFMAPEAQNQPALDSALDLIQQTVDEAIADGFTAEQIYIAGFSQGACLTLEYIASHARRYAGAVAFTGGLIGEQLDLNRYRGDLSATPVLITTGNTDTHVPLSRVEESVNVLQAQGATVTLKVYPGRPHTISNDELKLADEIIFAPKV